MNWDSSQKWINIFIYCCRLFCFFFVFFYARVHAKSKHSWKYWVENIIWGERDEGFSLKWQFAVKSGLGDVLRPLLYLTCVCQVLDQTVVVGRELSRKAKLLIFGRCASHLTLTLTLRGGDWKKLRPPKWSFFARGLCLDGARNSDTRGELTCCSFTSKRNQLRCLPPGSFPVGVFWARRTDKDNLNSTRKSIAGESVEKKDCGTRKYE